VAGFGGYPSFPPLVAARLRGVPTVLHEQNAVLGRANKMLARRVDAIATSFEATKFLDGQLLAKAGGVVRMADQLQLPCLHVNQSPRTVWRCSPSP
jgi:UDP-N-acetylglucosamine:LPS N-acetylglucosamine transferase